MKMTRKEALKLGAVGGVGLFLPKSRTAKAATLADRLPESQLPAPFQTELPVFRPLAPVKRTVNADLYQLTMKSGRAEIIPGLTTKIFGYNGQFPGPLITSRAGRRVEIEQRNRGPRTTSTHLDGAFVQPHFAGYANDAIPQSFRKTYAYPNEDTQRGRTIWYHDNSWRLAAQNIYEGLAGFYYIGDDFLDNLPIPQGQFDIHLMIRDALFAQDGSLIFDPDENGVFGDVLLVNGKPWPRMEVSARKYRFRIFNSSVSRVFDLALDSGDPVIVIGGDGGLFEQPVPTTILRVGMAEQYDFVVDFAKYRVGDQVILRNLRGDEPGTRRIMRFDVVRTARDDSSIPTVIRPIEEQGILSPTPLRESQAVRTRRLTLSRTSAGETINGRTWDHVVASHFTEVVANPKLDDVEIWEITNTSNVSPRPVHLHLVDFKILDRNGDPAQVRPYELPPKNTVYVGERETVRLIARFGPFSGRYMCQTTNLIHQSNGMMVQFQVGDGGPDPIETAPARRFR